MDALVLQCGGPTAVVNRSLAALVRRWRECAPGRTLHGGHQGLRALTTGDWRSLEEVSDDWLAAVETSPGMALGGGRDRLTAPELDDGLARLATRGIHTLFLIGGNGTIAAGRALSLRPSRAPLRLIAIPKTIDNDIPETDVCPGFPSAARFLVASVRDIGADAASMRGYEDVVLMETMGRHAGWLAAATALARSHAGDAPHLMLVPEVPFDEASFLAAVRNQHARTGIAVVTVAEGVRDAAGAFLAGRMADALVERDAAGQVIFGRSTGPSPYVASVVRERLGLRCRVVRPDLLQRCSQAHVSDLGSHARSPGRRGRRGRSRAGRWCRRDDWVAARRGPLDNGSRAAGTGARGAHGPRQHLERPDVPGGIAGVSWRASREERTVQERTRKQT